MRERQPEVGLRRGVARVEREHHNLAVAVGRDLHRRSRASVADGERRESVCSGGRRPELQHIGTGYHSGI